jgi:DedD protein
MELQVRERLVGALVLVALVVLFVPALLKGPPRKPADDAPGEEEEQVIEFPLPDSSSAPPDDALVPESEPEPEPEPEPAAMPSETPDISATPPEREPMPEPAPVATAAAAARDPARAATPEPPPSGVAAGQPAWAVQLGAFSTREKAENLVAELRKRGYAAFFLEYRVNGKVLHRVRVGPEQDRARAMAIADRLRKDGYLPVVARHP